MAAPLSVAAPLSAGPEMAWGEFEMKGPPHGQARPPGPYPGRIPSLWLFRAQIQSIQRSIEPNQLFVGRSDILPKARDTGRSILLWMLFLLDLGVI